jgi:hypothetical protein
MVSNVCRSFLCLNFEFDYDIFIGAGHPGEEDIGGLVLVRLIPFQV